MRQPFIYLLLISALFSTFASCSHHYSTADGQIWGTTYHIVYSGSPALADSIEAVAAAVDSSLSIFNAASRVRAINECRDSTADGHFVRVFDCARRVCGLSGGMFDPTVAPLADLWGFGPSAAAVAPDSAAIAAALAHVGLAECRIDPSGVVHKKTPATAFDFSALAKGYGVDLVADMLSRNGVENFMVEIGGEVAACGISPRGTPWRIQIDAPVSNALHSRLAIAELGPGRRAMASSGNYRNYRADSTGRRYGHTISPLSGRPVQTEVLAATVCAHDCMTADALATAAMCMDTDGALAMLKRAGATGLIVTAAPDSLIVRTTPASRDFR